MVVVIVKVVVGEGEDVVAFTVVGLNVRLHQ